jgi:hypothetical protein
MNLQNSHEYDQIQQQLGSIAERIRELEQQVTQQRIAWEADAREWRRLERDRSELGDWLVEEATNERGRVVKREINAALGGETYIPCTFNVAADGKRYRLALISTHYEVQET